MINVNLFYLTLPLVYQLLLIQIAKVLPLYQLLYSCHLFNAYLSVIKDDTYLDA